ncbi:MAG TPA: hypothetical protein VID67_01280, partial [Rhizomicrobium sp.]
GERRNDGRRRGEEGEGRRENEYGLQTHGMLLGLAMLAAHPVSAALNIDKALMSDRQWFTNHATGAGSQGL